MAERTERFLWVLAMAVIVVFTVPWFMWRSDAVAAGLPVWLWWHVGWMVLAAAVFWGFANRAWGMGVES